MRGRKSNGNTVIPSHPAVWWSRMKLRWPVLIWLIAVAALFMLHGRGGHGGQLLGVVDAVYEAATSPETALLTNIYVTHGQKVVAGDRLAQFDTKLLEAEIEVERLQTERQFEGSIIRLEEERRDNLRRLDEAKAELRALEKELPRMEELADRRLIDVREIIDHRMRRQALAEMVNHYPEAIARIEEELIALERRKDAAAVSLFGSAVTTAQPDQRDGWLMLRKARYTLRAQNDGVVTMIHRHPGDMVPDGMPVITLLVDSKTRITGFLPEWDRRQLETGMNIRVVRPADNTTATGNIIFVSPDVSVPPEGHTLSRQQPIRGRRFTVDVQEPITLLSGETVYLYTDTPWWHGLRLPWRVFR